jgi:hypothetical protein
VCPEPQKTIGHPAGFASRWSGNHVDVGDAVSESTGNGTMADRLHLGKGVNQATKPLSWPFSKACTSMARSSGVEKS